MLEFIIYFRMGYFKRNEIELWTTQLFRLLFSCDRVAIKVLVYFYFWLQYCISIFLSIGSQDKTQEHKKYVKLTNNRKEE